MKTTIINAIICTTTLIIFNVIAILVFINNLIPEIVVFSVNIGIMHTLILAPLIETLLFQFLLEKILYNKIDNKIINIISSIVFYATHAISSVNPYKPQILIVGYFLCKNYQSIKNDYGTKYAILSTMLIHFIANLFINIIYYLIQLNKISGFDIVFTV